MRLYIISALAIAFGAISFALQNNNLVTIRFLMWDYRQSLAIVLLVTLALGVCVGLLVSIPAILRRGWQVSRLEKQTIGLESEVQTQVQTIQAADQKAQDLHRSYGKLLTTLGLIEPTTGLLHSELTADALSRQWHDLHHHNQNPDAAAGMAGLGVLVLQVAPEEPMDQPAQHHLWQAVGQTLQQTCSVATWLYSDGKGTYWATVPSTDSEALTRYGEALQQAVLDQSRPEGGRDPLTVSVGGALVLAHQVTTGRDLVATARVALDQAQERGRNRLRILPVVGQNR